MKNNTENNTLINEFMGVHDKIRSTGNIHSWSDAPFYYTTEDTREKVIENMARYAKYSTSWDWLMRVVEKILKDFYKLNPCPIYLKMNIEKALNEVNIEAVYNACVEFIKWYNKTQNETN